MRMSDWSSYVCSSDLARELLTCLSLMLRRLPGSLAIAVVVIGVILAPSAGLIGASVATLALIALPSMLAQGYRVPLATGSVAAAGTLGLIFPPGLMLFFLADPMDVQLGYMFLATVVPGLVLAVLYVVYLLARTAIDPSAAPRVTETEQIPPIRLTIYVVSSMARQMRSEERRGGQGWDITCRCQWAREHQKK